MLEDEGILSRIGHTVISDSNGILWIFGGYHPDRGILQDLRAFDTKTEQLKIVNFQSGGKSGAELNAPSPRYFHAACFVPDRDSLFVHGGMTFSSQLGDFWEFSLADLSWSKLDNANKNINLALAGHTLTYVPDNNSILLIGGYSQDTGLNGLVYSYNIVRQAWTVLETIGYHPPGLFAHTATFYPGTWSIFVYGGVSIGALKVEVLHSLYNLDLNTKSWTIIPFNPLWSKGVYSSSNLLEARMFHSAVSFGRSIVLLGGESENNRISTLSVFWPECLQWIHLAARSQDLNFMRRQTEWIGSSLDSSYGARSVHVLGGVIYTIGGVRGVYRKYISKVQISQDACNLFSQSEVDCRELPDCVFCDAGGNSTLCYSQGGGGFPVLGSNSSLADGQLTTEVCTNQLTGPSARKCAERISSQVDIHCKLHMTCGECLYQKPRKGGPPLQPQCQWCHGCDRGGKCVHRGSDCGVENLCYSHQTALGVPGECPELECSSTSCTDCIQSNCFWSKQLTRSSKQRLSVGDEGVAWNCEKNSLLDILEKVNKTQHVIGESSPPLPCPAPCHTHTSCRTCLEGGGAEGGEGSCLWSTSLQRCLSPVVKPMLCLGGICGKVVKSPGTCPVSCRELYTCTACLQYTACGWCSSSLTQGHGFCYKGTLESPSGGTCLHILNSSKDWLNPSSVQTLREEHSWFTWYFSSCPPENECENGHHQCNSESEVCIDTPHSYRCECRAGYRGVSGSCEPVCEEPCHQGSCVSPGVCHCEFGYVGRLCELQCNCFGNSNCKGPNELDVCLYCENNTTGKNCDYCLPGFVGNPTKRKPCISCLEFCSGHSSECYSNVYIEQDDRSNSTSKGAKAEGLDEEQMSRLSKIGNGSGEAVCVVCSNNTIGERCEECIEGYFRTSDSIWLGCIPCYCNQHGDQCDPLTGGDCTCRNNTISEPNICTKKSGETTEGCWKQQCGKCKEFYIGDPTEGHQCYRSMSVDHDYCLEDGDITESCSGAPRPLRPGDTVLYAVQPKFRNVDIKIVVDVTQGSLDVYLSLESQVFMVNYNHSTGFNHVNFDTKYPISREPPVGLVETDWRKAQQENYFSRFSGYMPFQYVEKPRRNHPALASNLTVTTQKVFNLRETEGSDLKTFESLDSGGEVLLVKNLEHRLIISLQEKVHDLRASKFYILLQASVSRTSEPTLGNIFFRQDQLHIDLFVFFSVFFSCFFLILSVFVVFWKLKQVSNQRRARQRQVLELTLMAQRPFAKQDLILDPEEKPIFRPYESSFQAREKKLLKWNQSVCPSYPAGREERELRDSELSRRLLPPPDRHGIHAVTIEPTADGQAAVTSVFIQFPGDHIKLGVGCILTNKVFNNKSLKSYMGNHHNSL